MIALGPTPRILISRLSAIGDCIHTLPLATALRRRYPAAFIAWATQAGPASLIQGHVALDTVISVDRRWLKRLSGIRSLRRQLRAHRFDLVIDPQSLTKSGLLGWLSGAPRRIGFARGQGRELSPLISNVRVSPRKTHVVDRYLELLTPLGILSPDVTFDVPSCSAASTQIDKWLTQRSQGTKFALLNPGAGWNSKRWPHARYAHVARHLIDAHGLRSIVLWAGDQERTWAQEIVAATGQAAVLAPRTTLPELAVLCRRATLFVGSDTGPLHLAAAVNTPCVALYGPTRICECGPYGEGHEPLQVRFQGGRSKARRGDDNRAMRAISAELVGTACDRVIARTAHQAA